MTKVYFVRHAEPEHGFEDDRTRPLTAEGMADTNVVPWVAMKIIC